MVTPARGNRPIFVAHDFANPSNEVYAEVIHRWQKARDQGFGYIAGAPGDSIHAAAEREGLTENVCWWGGPNGGAIVVCRPREPVEHAAILICDDDGPWLVEIDVKIQCLSCCDDLTSSDPESYHTWLTRGTLAGYSLCSPCYENCYSTDTPQTTESLNEHTQEEEDNHQVTPDPYQGQA